LKIKKCHIAGVSLGGVVALLFAKKYPEKVKSLSFSGIFPVTPENWDELLREEVSHFEELFHNEEAVSFLKAKSLKNVILRKNVLFVDQYLLGFRLINSKISFLI